MRLLMVVTIAGVVLFLGCTSGTSAPEDTTPDRAELVQHDVEHDESEGSAESVDAMNEPSSSVDGNGEDLRVDFSTTDMASKDTAASDLEPDLPPEPVLEVIDASEPDQKADAQPEIGEPPQGNPCLSDDDCQRPSELGLSFCQGRCDQTYKICEYGLAGPPEYCFDGDPCTEDACVSGMDWYCWHPSVDCDDNRPCTLDTCESESGGCVHVDNGDCCSVDADCDDGNRCSRDSCIVDTGTCTYDVEPDCDPCILPYVDPRTCQCLSKPKCDDGKFWTRDTCNGFGHCLHEPDLCMSQACPVTVCLDFCHSWYDCGCYAVPRDCDDGDPCTLDFCDDGPLWSSDPCVHEPLACDSSDPCQESTCQPYTGVCAERPKCTLNNPLVTDSCDPVTGACTHEPSLGAVACSVDVDCDDLNACTVDTCDVDAKLCRYGSLDCDDGLCITTDSCDPATGCLHVPIEIQCP